MEKILDPHILIPLAVIVGSLSVVLIVLILVLKDKITSIHASRAGLHVHTNDIPVWSGIVDEIKKIDSDTAKSIRQGTTGLTILDPANAKYGVSAEVMLINSAAVAPLIYAAYENHHTHELFPNNDEEVYIGAEVYIANKAHEIFVSVQIWHKRFPVLTENLSDCFACLWINKVLIPNLRQACNKKIEFYKRTLREQKDMSKTVKDIVADRLCRNENYIKHIKELSEFADIKIKSSVFNQAS